jgi:hypothetical protein
MIRLRLSAVLLALLTIGTAHAAQTLAPVTDYTMPPAGQVTVPAEGGLTFLGTC